MVRGMAASAGSFGAGPELHGSWPPLTTRHITPAGYRPMLLLSAGGCRPIVPAFLESAFAGRNRVYLCNDPESLRGKRKLIARALTMSDAYARVYIWLPKGIEHALGIGHGGLKIKTPAGNKS